MKLCKSFEDLTPGPGAYDTSSSIEFKGAVTFRTPRFSTRNAFSPGPGSYHELSPRSSGGTFGRSTRSELFKLEKLPGPGRYSPNGLPHGPSYSMQGKKSQIVKESPGPATYSPRFIVKKSNTLTIGKSKRTELTVVLDTPGPGRYEKPQLKDAPSWSFHGIKDPSFVRDTPGPGRYESPGARSIACSTPKAKRQELFYNSLSPGPGAYDSKDLKSQMIKYSIGKSKRPEINSITPGPGKYEPKQLNHSSSLRFGTELKKTLEFRSEAPAANVYSPRSMDKAPAYSFGKRYQVKPVQGVPGPGTYNGDVKSGTPRTILGKSMRFIKSFTEKEELERPGPGNYEIQTENFKGRVFIAKAKKGQVKATISPGPGHYNA